MYKTDKIKCNRLKCLQYERRDLPRERENLLGKFPEQGILGGIGDHQYNIDMARSQLDQVTDVCDVRQFCHFHKVLLGRTTVRANNKEGQR